MDTNKKLLEAISILINKNNEKFPKFYKAKIIETNRGEDGTCVILYKGEKKIAKCSNFHPNEGVDVLICELPNKEKDCFIIGG